MAHLWDMSSLRLKLCYDGRMAEGFLAAIRSERQRMKMSLREFAGLIGVSVASIKRWESEISLPSEAQRESIFDTLAAGERYQPPQNGIHPGWWLRLARHSQRVSIRRAGELSDVSPSAWQRFETGQTRIGFQQASRLVLAIGDTVNDANSVISPAFLDRAETESFNEPHVWGSVLMTSLLRQDPLFLRDEIQPENTCRALVILARTLMQIGDHDLCGQAYFAAYSLGKKSGIDSESLAKWQLSSVWTGFPVIKAPRFASARLSWLEKKLAPIGPVARADYGIMRAMFLDWAGYPSLAKEMLERPHDSPAYEILANLMLAWLEARYGDPQSAIRSAEPWFEYSAPSIAFLARKVALEACFQRQDFHGAAEHFSALEIIRDLHGHWSPDLAARKKKILERLGK